MNSIEARFKFPESELFSKCKLEKAVTNLFAVNAVLEDYYYLSVTEDYSVTALLNVKSPNLHDLHVYIYLLVLETIYNGVESLCWSQIYIKLVKTIQYGQA
jgi:hypothetical protein